MLLKWRTYYRLGIGNVLRVLHYRLCLKFGWFARVLPVHPCPDGPFFTRPDVPRWDSAIPPLNAFGWLPVSTEAVPNWFENLLTGKACTPSQQHWSTLADFDPEVGDIKGVWDLSRWGWLAHFALAYRCSGEQHWIDKMNLWLEDWCAANPVNQGLNWKCAQEAAIRVMHLAVALCLFEQRQPSDAVLQLVREHLLRIERTLRYAKGQDNNHGTSEGAALYIGATLLLHAEPQDRRASAWRTQSIAYLTERSQRLIAPDGTFSQYSSNYHRLMLDTFTLTEVWRRFMQQGAFPQSLQQQLRCASRWLLAMLPPHTTDVPNWGANDGAQLQLFWFTEYRSFLPSALAAQMMWEGPQQPLCLLTLHQLGCAIPAEEQQSGATTLANGGLAIAKDVDAMVMLRAPAFDFRPGQEDCLHLDLWVKGDNLLADGGSYSYNTDDATMAYFNGPQGHNTIQFDGQPQMPRISRFLLGDWLHYDRLDANRVSDGFRLYGAYRKRQLSHQREVLLEPGQLTVIDTVQGVASDAVMRWRLPARDWICSGQEVTGGNVRIAVTASVPLQRFLLAEGLSSRYYGKKQSVPVLEASIEAPAGIITTIIRWT
ncbi:heparinase II/III family protein [Aestuariibacter halophilus]|uniref:Heparinase II/III family protein n=1 Tax=Fluctibacter halophilus TaxID=226011 RepID=A0ABS8GDZ9_9ALTE|nr:heparinase II/III family protein [Aestuariibacter halophilus]MCC2618336.1 heparinase II/III family protein [Aestuariibacter halophilus]